MIHGALGQYAVGQEAQDGAAPADAVVATVELLAGGAVVGSDAAPGDIIEIDVTLIPGAATGSANEIGWFGRPALPSWYRMPRVDQHVDAVAPGAFLQLAGELVAGGAHGSAVHPGRLFGIRAELLPGRAYAGASARRLAAFQASQRAIPRVSKNPTNDDELSATFPQESWRPWRRAADVRAPRPPASTGWYRAADIAAAKRPAPAQTGWRSAATARDRAAARPRSSSGWRRAGG
jgi:hypothetical protein